MAGREHRELLSNASGAKEDVAPLLRTEHAEISGVLGSAAGVGNMGNPPGDDFLLMPHAVPGAPFPYGFLRCGVEFVLHPEPKQWRVEEIDHGAVHGPRGPDTLQLEVGGQTVDAVWSVAGRELNVKVGSRGSTVLLASGHDPAAMAHAIAAELAASEAARVRKASLFDVNCRIRGRIFPG